MADDKQLNIIIRLKDQATKSLNGITGAFKKFAVSPFKQVTGMIGGLGSSLLSLKGIIVGGAIGALGKEVIDITAKFEQWEIAFGTLTGSAENASRLLRDIKDFAAKTPFELPGLVDSSKQLLAFGFAQEEIIDTMRRLGDISAGVGTDKLPTLVNALGKIRTKGRASLEELNMMLEAGVPILDSLADGFGVTKEQLFDMITKGQVGFEDVNAALTRLTEDGSMFGGLMEKQSSSLSGIFSNVKDNLVQLALSIGNELLPYMKKLATSIRDFTGERKNVVSLTNSVIDFINIVRGVSLSFEEIKQKIIEVVDYVDIKFTEVAIGIQNGFFIPMAEGIVRVAKIFKINTEEMEKEVHSLKKEEEEAQLKIIKIKENSTRERMELDNKWVAYTEGKLNHISYTEEKTSDQILKGWMDNWKKNVAGYSEMNRKLETESTKTNEKIFDDYKYWVSETEAIRNVDHKEKINKLEEYLKTVESGSKEEKQILTELNREKKALRKEEEAALSSTGNAWLDVAIKIREAIKEVSEYFDTVLFGGTQEGKIKKADIQYQRNVRDINKEFERGQITQEKRAEKLLNAAEDYEDIIKDISDESTELSRLKFSDALDPVKAAARVADADKAMAMTRSRLKKVRGATPVLESEYSDIKSQLAKDEETAKTSEEQKRIDEKNKKELEALTEKALNDQKALEKKLSEIAIDKKRDLEDIELRYARKIEDLDPKSKDYNDDLREIGLDKQRDLFDLDVRYKRKIEDLNFAEGGVIPKSKGTIGDRYKVGNLGFNGGELVSNQMEQANILHHMSKNRGATLPPSIGGGGNGAPMTVILQIGERKIAETFVNAYNRNEKLKLIPKLRV